MTKGPQLPASLPSDVFPSLTNDLLPIDRVHLRNVRTALVSASPAGGAHTVLHGQAARLLERLERELEAAHELIRG